MGIDVWTAKFLKSEARRGVDFARTLTLGRQTLYMTQSEYAGVYAPASTSRLSPKGLFADDFLCSLGAGTLDAIDVSDYEGANIIHDLNLTLTTTPEQRWTCVFDGGALEHIFYFPTAIRNCMEATAVGGHFLTVCPWTGYAGHGFYQFSPELLYRVLSPENGFEVERMLIRLKGSWREIIDPRKLGRRFEVQSRNPTVLFVSARRTREADVFACPPQQSDYVTMWAEELPPPEPAVHGLVRRLAETLLPGLTRYFRTWREERRALERGTVPAQL
jgi:hypothetical protein